MKCGRCKKKDWVEVKIINRKPYYLCDVCYRFLEALEQKEKTLEKIIKSIPYVIEGNNIWFISEYVRPNEWQMAKLLDEGYILGYDTSKQKEIQKHGGT